VCRASHPLLTPYADVVSETLCLALAFWQTLLPPVFAAEPSALASATPNGAPAMGAREFGWWCEFLESKGVKGVSKDVWNLVRVRRPRETVLGVDDSIVLLARRFMQFIEYAVKIPSTYDTYDEEGASCSPLCSCACVSPH
jgi:hypothetical protein